MNATQISQALAAKAHDDFSCEELPNSAVRITTPLLYPDRTMIDVYVVSDGDAYTVTDLGEALGWLWTRRGIDALTKRQNELLDHVQRTSGVAISRGRLRRDCQTLGDLSLAVYSVAQTALRLADLWFTSAPRAKREDARQDSREQVGAWLTSLRIPFNTRTPTEGHSGRRWTIDFRVAGQRDTLVQWVNGRDQQSADAAINAAYAAFGDIANSSNGVRDVPRIALFNDALPYWTSVEYKLIKEVAEPAKWTERAGLEEILRVPDPAP